MRLWVFLAAVFVSLSARAEVAMPKTGATVQIARDTGPSGPELFEMNCGGRRPCPKAATDALSAFFEELPKRSLRSIREMPRVAVQLPKAAVVAWRVSQGARYSEGTDLNEQEREAFLVLEGRLMRLKLLRARR